MATAASRAVTIALCTSLALAVVAVIGFFTNSYFDRRAGRAFYAVKMGAPESAVIAALGNPDVERPCGQNLWWGDDYHYRGKNDGRCVAEVRYEYFLSAWAIGYSKDRRVVSKYHYFSE
jgi:hypothetical protein